MQRRNGSVGRYSTLVPEVRLSAKEASMLGEIAGQVGATRHNLDARRSAVASVYRSRPKLVVVVDDEPSIQELMTLILEDECGYEVRCAANGADALEMLRELPLPDLLIIDLMMPVMDGWGLLAALRRDERTAPIPVIVSSAVGYHDATSLGAARVLTKPIDYDALLAAVQELTGGHEACEAPESA